MSFFGDLVKSAKKGVKSFKKLQRGITKIEKPLRPLIKKIPVVGGAAVKVAQTAESLSAEKERRKKGTPRRFGILSPAFIQASQRLLTQSAAAGIRIATGRIEPPRTAPLRPVRETPAFQRTVPERAMAARVGVRQRRPIMPLTPVRSVPAVQPAGFRLRVPPALRDPIEQLKRALPIERVPAAPGVRSLVPMADTTDKIGRPLIVEPELEERVRCPPGYLAVTMPDGGRACVLAGVAIAAGLAKRRKKPLISVRDSNAISRANAARGRLKRATQKAGFQVAEKRRTVRRKNS